LKIIYSLKVYKKFNKSVYLSFLLIFLAVVDFCADFFISFDGIGLALGSAASNLDSSSGSSIILRGFTYPGK